MTLKCPACSAVIQADDAYAGLEGECPTCGADIHIPHLAPAPIRPSSRPPPATTTKRTTPTDHLLRAGWICFGIGALIMPFTLIFPIWGPLFSASFILSIIVMGKGRIKTGLVLLLCTIFIPFAIAAVVVTTAMGAAFAITDNLFKMPQPPQTRVVAKHNIAPIPTETLPINSVLTEINIYGQKYKDAQTSVRKDEIIKQAQMRVAELYRNRALVFRAIINDVSAPQPGTTRLEYSMDNPNTQSAHPFASISTIGHIDLNLSRENALKLVPGQKIQITASVVFTPTTSYMTSSATPVNISLNNNRIGQLKLKTYRCSIVPANP